MPKKDLVDAYVAAISLLRRNLTQMKLINGPEEKCLIWDIRDCVNHQVIRDTEDYLKALYGVS